MVDFIMKIIGGGASFVLGRQIDSYKVLTTRLRESLNGLERGTVPDIDFENDIKLMDRAKGLLLQFKGKQHRLDAVMLSRLEKLVAGIEKMRCGWRIKAARKVGLL